MMMKIYFISSFFIMLGLISACEKKTVIEEQQGVVYVRNPKNGLWQDSNKSPIHFELEQIFGVESQPAEAILASVNSIAVDSQGYVYVLDRRDHRLVCFFPDGTVRWSKGKKGQGPGELLNAMSLVLDNQNRLFISNQNGSRIDVFDTEGNFLESHSMTELGLTIASIEGYLPPNTLVLSKIVFGLLGAEIALCEYGLVWKKILEFKVDQSGGMEVPANVADSPDYQSD